MSGEDTLHDILTVHELNTQLTLYLEGRRTARALAKWAFDRFSDQEEGLIVYEEGQETTIAAVLDDLIWADSEPFKLDEEMIRRLQQQITKGQTGDQTR